MAGSGENQDFAAGAFRDKAWFYSETKDSKVRYHINFTANLAKARGDRIQGRVENFFAEYTGKIESFEQLRSDIKKQMQKSIEEKEKYHSFELDDSGFLSKMITQKPDNLGLKEGKVKQELREDNELKIEVGNDKQAASLIKLLLKGGIHSGNDLKIGMTRQDFEFKQIPDPDIKIKVKDDIDQAHIFENEGILGGILS